ncbi:1396_t:CDS:1, partial [Gigaspora rosea]
LPPQIYDEVKKKEIAIILKIVSKEIVEKLLKRCEYYKAIITKKTETIKSKNELITLLAQRLANHESDLFQANFKNVADQ